MKTIDITMTATLRPSVLNCTLDNIKKFIVDQNSKEFNFRLIVNIDPIGEKVNSFDIVEICKSYFPNLIFNTPQEPSFAKAVKWVWINSSSEFVFHIEDDWLFNKKVDILKMIYILKKYPDLSSLRLYKHNTPKLKVIDTFNCKWNYNKDGFYLADDYKNQFGLNPILIKRKFILDVLPKMVDNINPEKQFRSTQNFMEPIIKKWKYGLFTTPGELAIISDIGRYWMERQSLKKPIKKTFLTWENK